MSAFDVLDTPPTELGEGPFWDVQRNQLGFVDITQGRLHLVDETGREVDRIEVAGDLSAAVPLRDRPSSWLVANGNAVAVLDREGSVTHVADTQGAPMGRVRLNDGKCDANGRFWVGSMSQDLVPGLGRLYRIDGEGTCRVADEGLTLSNGLGWSPDSSRFYLIDTIPGILFVWDFDLDAGEIRNKRVLSDSLGTGLADGLTVDSAGRIWVAFCGSGVIRCFDDRGRLLAEYETPVSQPTCPTFGGADGKTLFVTSATVTLSQEALANEPAGRVLAMADTLGGPTAHSFVWSG
jgi:sugar lactone lactonase YvrE